MINSNHDSQEIVFQILQFDVMEVAWGVTLTVQAGRLDFIPQANGLIL